MSVLLAIAFMSMELSKNDQTVLSWSLHIGPCPNTAYTEARAIYKALKRADLLGITHAQLFTDSQVLWTTLTHQSTNIHYDWCHLLQAY